MTDGARPGEDGLPRARRAQREPGCRARNRARPRRPFNDPRPMRRQARRDSRRRGHGRAQYGSDNGPSRAREASRGRGPARRLTLATSRHLPRREARLAAQADDSRRAGVVKRLSPRTRAKNAVVAGCGRQARAWRSPTSAPNHIDRERTSSAGVPPETSTCVRRLELGRSPGSRRGRDHGPV